MTKENPLVWKISYSARVIPMRGLADFEFDPKDLVYVRIDRRRKLPVTILLRALGLSAEEILDTFFDTDTFQITEDGYRLILIANRLRGEPLSLRSKMTRAKCLCLKAHELQLGISARWKSAIYRRSKCLRNMCAAIDLKIRWMKNRRSINRLQHHHHRRSP